MKKFTLLLLLISTVVSTYAQKSGKKTDRISLKNEPDSSSNENLVSNSSFKKIYARDFSALSGIAVQPQNQLILTLNKPEIFLGGMLTCPKKGKAIPAVGFYPYFIGKLNDDGEFIFRKAREYDPNIGVGGKLFINPLGFKFVENSTLYFFNNKLAKTQAFAGKRNLAQLELDKKYKTLDSLKKYGKSLNTSIEAASKKISKNELVKSILQNSPQFGVIDNDTTISIIDSKRQSLTISNEELDAAVQKIIQKQGYIDSIAVDGTRISIKMTDNSKINLSADQIVKAYILSETDIAAQNAKILKAQEELAKIDDLNLYNRKMKVAEKKLKKHYESELYELEKDAPWTSRYFFWISVDGKINKQTVNVFRNDALEEVKGLRQDFVGISANLTSVMNKAVFNGFISYELEKKRKFLDLTPKTFITDSSRISTFNTIDTKKAYNLNDLSQKDFDEMQTNKVLNFGMTGLIGDKRKFGITTNIKYTTNTKSTNLKMGLIIPAYKSADGEQANIVLEYQVPDINTKLPANEGKKPSERAYASIKVGIPISMLKSN